jgi:hypothetical protein
LRPARTGVAFCVVISTASGHAEQCYIRAAAVWACFIID